MSMMITDFLVSRGLQTPIEEYVKEPPGYQCFNSGGVEVEVAEFLYSLVHLLKAKTILETGTHLGISSTYMAQALKELGRGTITTLEVIPELWEQAKQLWEKLQLTDFIDSHLKSSLEVELSLSTELDILFLDSEPQYRFDELLRFWHFVKPGGIIMIHDMDENIGFHNTWTKLESGEEIYSWPYGDFKEKIGSLISQHEVQVISFGTPRGLTIFQKHSEKSVVKKFLQRTDKTVPMPDNIIKTVESLLKKE